MATNPPKGSGRIGAVKGRTQVFNPQNERWVKVDTETGKFVNQKAEKASPFKGVTKKK